jgi:glutathione S-transferase
MAHDLKLVSFDICPYVERSRIVLLEKQVAHSIELIDLSNKPRWFLDLSPMGKVPVLVVDGRPVFESMVINELIEELYPQPAMLPAEPLARAEARAWIVYCNDAVMPASYRSLLALAGGRTGEALEKPLAELRGALARAEAEVARRGGPWFLGKQLTLVDAAWAPFLRRWAAAEEWGMPEQSRLAAFPALRAWTDRLLSHRSVAAADPGEIGPRMRRLYAERAARGG